jgi:signal transduction histidine kinase
MKALIKLILLCVMPLCTIAQTDPTWGYITAQQADSLKRTLQTEKNDTLKMATYRSLGLYYQEINTDSGCYFHTQQLALAKKLNMKLWEADANGNISFCFVLLNDIMKSYEYNLASKKLVDDGKNETDNWRPWTFSNSKNSYEARITILSRSYRFMAYMWGPLGEKEKEKSVLLEAAKLGESINNAQAVYSAYSNLSDRISPDSAIFFTNKALKVAEAGGFKRTGRSFTRLSRIYLGKKMYDSAFVFARKSIAINKAENTPRSLVESYGILSTIFGELNFKDSSLFYANKAMETAWITGLPQNLLNAYRRLSFSNQLYNKIDSALKYEQLANNLNDSLQKRKIDDLIKYQNFSFNEQLRLKKLEEEKTAYANNLKMLGLLAVLGGILVAAFILYRNNRQKQKANIVLQEQKDKVESTLHELKSTQAQLIQSEKMASLGELTAGIAHEIQNPLNFVNNFSEVSNELISELVEEVDKGNTDEVKLIAKDVQQNLEKIHHHGKRADAIVKGMLQHSRASTGQKEPTDINALCDEYLRLAYHGLKARDNSFEASFHFEPDNTLPNINVVPQDIGRVLLNLINNAFQAVAEKQKTAGPNYNPEVRVSTKLIFPPAGGLRGAVSVSDNGPGIPNAIKDKIFQPFFTTKPTGQGTGLGLSLSYDIVKAHGGELKMETKEGEGSEFIISLPVNT